LINIIVCYNSNGLLNLRLIRRRPST